MGWAFHFFASALNASGPFFFGGGGGWTLKSQFLIENGKLIPYLSLILTFKETRQSMHAFNLMFLTNYKTIKFDLLSVISPF